MSEKLSLSDIVALAKQGYKPSDIKELLNTFTSMQSSGEAEQKTEDNPQNDEAEEEKGEARASENDEADAINIKEEKAKSEIEDLKKQIIEAKKELKEAQQANTSKDISKGENKKSDVDIINEMARNFM